MLNLYRSNIMQIESAYIITVKGDVNSEKYSLNCQKSCEAVGMPYKVWDAYNGIGTPGVITPPEHMKNDSIMNILKITDHYLTRGEVACALSHISLWVHCALIDRPIVILEHDAYMIRKLDVKDSYNSIVYLGGQEWVNDNWKVYPIPPHASEGKNVLFICRAHAYCIDPVVAKNMISYVLTHGICDPLDIMLKADIFNITHQGIYASDVVSSSDDTTILSRPKEGRTTIRNEDLKW